MAGFEESYRGSPPWDIGRPQPELVHLEESGEIVGRVLDVGCGTGENALYFASRGHEVWGVDLAPTALKRAKAKAAERSLPATFRRADALALGTLRERFDTVTDCGLFHALELGQRPEYASSLDRVLVPGGRLFILCFSEHEPADWGGPRRVTQAEIRETFHPGWEVAWIREARFDTRLESIQGRAWLSAIRKPTNHPVAAPRGRAVGPSPRRATRKSRPIT